MSKAGFSAGELAALDRGEAVVRVLRDGQEAIEKEFGADARIPVVEGHLAILVTGPSEQDPYANARMELLGLEA